MSASVGLYAGPFGEFVSAVSLSYSERLVCPCAGTVRLCCHAAAEAVVELQAAVELVPTDTRALVLLGRALLATRNAVAAAEAFARALRAGSSPSDARVESSVWQGIDPESGLPLPVAFSTADVATGLANALYASGEEVSAVSLLTKVLQVGARHVVFSTPFRIAVAQGLCDRG